MKTHIKKVIKANSKLLTISLILFIFSLISYALLSESYIKKSELNYTNSVKSEIKLLIKAKELEIFGISKNFAINKKLIKIMEKGDYEKLYKNHLFQIATEYNDFKNLGIHIIDNKGINRYLSWSHKSIGKDIVKARPDLAQLLKNPKPLMNISVGKFDITFKGQVPVFNKSGKLLGIIEIIAHFNSISKALAKNGIFSAVIVDKRFKKQLLHHFSPYFVSNYMISNLDLKPEIKEILEKKGIEYFKNIETYSYIVRKDEIVDGFYVISIPILGFDGKTIGWYVAFIEDKFELAEKETFLNIIILFMTLLFSIMGYLVHKENSLNLELIKYLDEEVKKEVEENLKLLYNDSLTGSYKRIKFEKDRNLNKDSDVVMINIRNFSQINKVYGFKIGDMVLKQVVFRIEKLLKRKIYRNHADEFIFFSNNIEIEIVEIKNIFSTNPLIISKNEKDITLRLSFNFSVTKNSGDEILRKLSIALKEAKGLPFKTYIRFKEIKSDDSFLKFNELLYEAIFDKSNRVEIVPFFQGIRDNIKGKIIKYEALARLKTEDKIYSPYFFINVAKNSGFLNEVTKIMVDKSFKYLSELENEQITFSINLTEDDLLNENFVDFITSKLRLYKLNANRIVIEILEGVTANGTKNHIKMLNELKNLGFKLAIDDFGVEYSNFERVKELNIDFLKIDAKYIKELATSDKSYKITKAIADFAHSLDIKVIAEFVENAEIQKKVEELGIEFSQGYFYSIPKEEIIK